MRILVTGATGKVGRALIARLGAALPEVQVRALCHNRTLEETERLEVVRGSIADREVCAPPSPGSPTSSTWRPARRRRTP